MIFSEEVKKHRKRLGMTQKEFAEACGISVRILQNYESGSRIPKYDTFIKIRDYLNLSTEELISSEDYMYMTLGKTDETRPQRSFLERAEDCCAFMAGGDIPQEDMDEAFKMITLAYTKATEKNKKKYTPKKYRN